MKYLLMLIILCSCSRYTTFNLQGYDNVVITNDDGSEYTSIKTSGKKVKLYYIKLKNDSIQFHH